MSTRMSIEDRILKHAGELKKSDGDWIYAGVSRWNSAAARGYTTAIDEVLQIVRDAEVEGRND